MPVGSRHDHDRNDENAVPTSDMSPHARRVLVHPSTGVQGISAVSARIAQTDQRSEETSHRSTSHTSPQYPSHSAYIKVSTPAQYYPPSHANQQVMSYQQHNFYSPYAASPTHPNVPNPTFTAPWPVYVAAPQPYSFAPSPDIASPPPPTTPFVPYVPYHQFATVPAPVPTPAPAPAAKSIAHVYAQVSNTTGQPSQSSAPLPALPCMPHHFGPATAPCAQSLSYPNAYVPQPLPALQLTQALPSYHQIQPHSLQAQFPHQHGHSKDDYSVQAQTLAHAHSYSVSQITPEKGRLSGAEPVSSHLGDSQSRVHNASQVYEKMAKSSAQESAHCRRSYHSRIDIPQTESLTDSSLREPYATSIGRERSSYRTPHSLYSPGRSGPYAIKAEMTLKRRRLQWTDSLSAKFENALKKLGEDAVPKAILKEMNVHGLTRANVASHLQKYREFKKKQRKALLEERDRNQNKKGINESEDSLAQAHKESGRDQNKRPAEKSCSALKAESSSRERESAEGECKSVKDGIT